MRRSLSSLAALTLTAALLGCAANASETAATFTAQDSLAVTASTEAWVNGALKRDFTLFATSVTPDVILYPANAKQVQGREAAVEFVKNYPVMSVFNVNVAELVGRGDVAFDHGTYTTTLTLPNGAVVNDTGSFASLFKKQPDGTWAHHRVMFHSNLPPLPAPVAAPVPAARRQ
jgi:ketosteroid isomerase-like protein